MKGSRFRVEGLKFRAWGFGVLGLSKCGFLLSWYFKVSVTVLGRVDCCVDVPFS